MTSVTVRNVLATVCSALCLGVGLATAIVQSRNHAEAFELDEIRSECRMVEAVNSARFAEVLALDWGPEAGRELEAGEAGTVSAEGVQ